MTNRILFFALFLGCFVPAFGQTQVAPIVNPHIQLFNGGAPCNGCLLDSFSAGTTSPLATFSESTGTTLNSNPVVADTNGFVTVYLTSASYKLRLRTSAGVTIWTQDNVSWATPLSTFSGINSTGAVVIKPATAATSLANQSSPTLCIQGFYFNVTSLTDQWCLSDVLGTGAAPTTTFTVAHSGSGGTVSLNLPQVAITFGNLSAPAFIDSVGTPATSGQVRLANSDQECWRNTAASGNVCDSDAGAAAAGTGNLADNLAWSGGGFQGGAFVDKSAAPANSGVVRVGNNVAAVVARNAAGSGDVQAVLVDASNVTNLGGTAGIKVPGPIVGGLIGLVPSKQIFVANGTFTIPANVTAVKATIIGGGGAGGGSTASANGSGGGAAGFAQKWLSGLTPGNTIAVTVGAGGTGVSGAGGNTGGASSIASGTQTITTVTANGGGGGATTGTGIQAGGTGGTATNGDLNFPGNGGGITFTAGVGGPGAAGVFGGSGAVSDGAGTAPGAGGAGGNSGGTTTGGAGFVGIVIFEWVQ